MNDLGKLIALNPEYPQWVAERTTDMRKYFEKTKYLLSQKVSDDNFNEAFQNFYRIVSVIPLLKNTIAFPQIVRARANYNGAMFSEKSELSYNLKNKHKIELGRFNRKGEPLFYGSLPVEESELNSVLACALECCKELIDKDKAPKVQDFTIGAWRIEQPFEVITMCFNEKHLSKNPSLKQGVDNYLSDITEHFNAETSSFIKEFLHYYSDLSTTLCKQDNTYYVLSALFVAIRYHYKKVEKQRIYGLIYPSAMTDSEGLTIVLTRYAVDHFLRLDKVMMYRYFLEKTNNTYIADKCSEMVKVTGDIFNIPGFIPQGQTLKFHI